MKATLLRRAAPWLLGPALLLGLVLAVALVVAPGTWRPSLGKVRMAAGALFAVPVLWVVISALWPARADRTCPNCGQAGLRRLNRRSTRGIVCNRCDHRDPTRSSWFLAEEEGPLETTVLEERARTAPRPPVESVGRSD